MIVVLRKPMLSDSMSVMREGAGYSDAPLAELVSRYSLSDDFTRWDLDLADLARACGFALVPLEANVPTGFACGADVVDEVRKILNSPVPKPCPVEALAARYDVEVLEYPASMEPLKNGDVLSLSIGETFTVTLPGKADPERELQEMRAQTRRSIAMGPL